VQTLISQGDWQQAQDKLVAVSTQVATIDDQQQKQELLDQFNDLSAKVVERDPAATAPPGSALSARLTKTRVGMASSSAAFSAAPARATPAPGGSHHPASGSSAVPPGHSAPGGQGRHASPAPHTHSCPALALSNGCE
jgi:hypothetical protein